MGFFIFFAILNSIIHNRLQPILAQKRWDELIDYLQGLSNSQFREAGNMLGGKLSEEMDDATFCQLFDVLVAYHSRAFLGTMLKAIAARIQRNPEFLHNGNLQCSLGKLSGNEIDVQKTLVALIPCADNPNDIQELFQLLGVDNPLDRLPALLKTVSMPAAYVLLCTLQQVEDNRPLLLRTAYYLIRRGDALSFNLASLLRHYFGLEEVKGTFSLSLQPYQLARLAASYSAFSQCMSL